MRARLIATLSIGLISAACQAPPSQNALRYVAPEAHSAGYATSVQACVGYGYAATSADFNQCVMDERRARSFGRRARDNAEAELVTDLCDACNSYDLEPGHDV